MTWCHMLRDSAKWCGMVRVGMEIYGMELDSAASVRGRN